MAQISRAEAQAISEPGHYLRPDAADAWERARKAFGKRVLITDSLRPIEVQERIFRERYVAGNHAGKPGYTNDVRTWQGQKWTRKTGTAAAAVPGTSNHGGGVAVDVRTVRRAEDPAHSEAVVFTSFNDPDRLAWLKAAKDHGWADDEGRAVNELWHMTYYPARDKHAKPATTTALPVLRQGDKGTPVKTLQTALNNQKTTNPKLTVDGDFGTRTTQAVKTFQTSKGLAADGIVGAKTYTALGIKN